MQIPQTPINISEIPAVRGDYYENIFNVYQASETQGNYYYYNIGNKVVIDVNNIDESYIDYYFIDKRMPLTYLSYLLFGTMHLWWLIAAVNNLNPIEVPPAGITIAAPRREYLQVILNAIKQK